MTSFAQKILVDCDCHEFAMTQKWKDVVGIVSFNLIGFLPTNHIFAYITMAYEGLWGTFDVNSKIA